MKKNLVIFSVSIVLITILSAFNIYYTSGCPYHSGSPADGLTCASCHLGGINTPSVIITSTPAFGAGNTYIPGATYTISVTGQGYNLFGFDLEILNSPSNIANTVLDFGTINSITSNETVNIPSMGNGYTYSDIMHTAPKSNPFIFIWDAPMSGTGYLYCALLGINNNGNTSGDNSCTTSMTLSPSTINGLNQHPNNNLLIDLSIYPNPCLEKIHLTYYLKESKKVTIELYSSFGIKIYDLFDDYQNEGIQNEQYIIPSFFPKGNYLLKLTADNKSITRNIVLR